MSSEGGSRRIAFNDERDQCRVLFRTFLERLFENDLFPETVDLRLLAVWLAAALVSPPAILWLLGDPFRWSIGCRVGGPPAWLFAVAYRRRRLASSAPLVYEDEVEPAVRVMGLTKP